MSNLTATFNSFTMTEIRNKAEVAPLIKEKSFEKRRTELDHYELNVQRNAHLAMRKILLFFLVRDFNISVSTSKTNYHS